MRWLLDENLGPRLPALVGDLYPGSSQVDLGTADRLLGIRPVAADA